MQTTKGVIVKDQINTIRELLNGMALAMPATADKALTALSELEAMAGEPVACERCEELGYDKATYFRLYEQACIELQQIKKQAPAAEIKVSYSSIEGEGIEVLSCELGEGVHTLYAAPVAQQPKCVCGQPTSLGVVHRTDGPCFVYEAQQPPKLEDIEQYRMQMAGICTAATGYWKEGDPIHPDYDTPALREVAKLYAKYDAFYKAQQPQAEPDWINGVPHWSPALIAKVKHMAAELDEPKQPQAEAVPIVQVVNCDTCKHSANSCDDCPCNRCGVEFGDGPFNRWEAPQQAEEVPPGYAGVMVWIGDKQVVRVATEVEISHEREPGFVLKHAALIAVAAIAQQKGN